MAPFLHGLCTFLGSVNGTEGPQRGLGRTVGAEGDSELPLPTNPGAGIVLLAGGIRT